jgi:hypothetical protein
MNEKDELTLSQMLTDYAEANAEGKRDMFEEAAERMITAERRVSELEAALKSSTDLLNLASQEVRNTADAMLMKSKAVSNLALLARAAK